MKNNKSYIGKYKEDAKEYKGWFIGQFVKGGLCKTDRFEVKYWQFKKGENPQHKRKYLKIAIECTFILKGSIDGEIDGDTVSLEEGDYVVIAPGVKNNFPVNVYEDVEGLTIKAPSVLNDKVEV